MSPHPPCTNPHDSNVGVDAVSYAQTLGALAAGYRVRLSRNLGYVVSFLRFSAAKEVFRRSLLRTTLKTEQASSQLWLRGTLQAGFRSLGDTPATGQAIDCLGHVDSQGHLAHMGRPHQQVGVGHPVRLEGGIELADDVVLAVNLPHGLNAP